MTIRRLAAAALLVGAASVGGALAGEAGIQAPGPLAPLQGTLLTPDDATAAPVVLIIPGSGLTDRDGNSPHGIRAATYRRLAEGLAARGIASVRIDKRGMFASGAAVADANDVTLAAYADDVASWIDAIRARTGARCVWLLGHSEGGLVALTASARDLAVCGLVLATTPGRPLGENLLAQLSGAGLPAMQRHQATQAIDDLTAGRRVDVTMLPPALRALFRPEIQGFLIDLLRFSPRAAVAAYDGPVLILEAGRDLQVGAGNAAVLHGARPDATLVTLPDTNHMLKPVSEDGRTANFAAYADPHLPLAPGVVDAIADFIAPE